jgi:hypothetical protein
MEPNKVYTYKEVGELLLQLYTKRTNLLKELNKLEQEIELSQVMLMFAYNREK